MSDKSDMRRKDLEHNNIDDAYELIDQMSEGVLATIASHSDPSIRPVNHVRIDNSIYFHGARSGEKIQGVGKRVSFNVYRPLSLIPSYWCDLQSACPATALFQSVIIKGQLNIVLDHKIKANAFQKLMEKLQPEGQHLNFNTNIDFYKKSMDHVGMFEIPIETFSYKLKLGQNWDQEKIELVKGHLHQRGHSLDLETLKLMDRFLVIDHH